MTILFSLAQAAPKVTATTVTLAVGGSATYLVDYTMTGPIIFNSPTLATATIPANSTSIEFQLVASGDTLVETNESVTLSVVNVNGQPIVSPILISATIIDDDPVRNRIVFNPSLVESDSSPGTIYGTSNAEDIYVSSGVSAAVDAGAGNDTVVAGFTATGSGAPIANGTPDDLYILGGGGGDDVVKGGPGFNLLSGTSDPSQGSGEHDILIGHVSALNFFTLAGTTAWYAAQGALDYVSILNFNPDSDIISLAGLAGDYTTTYNAQLTYLYYIKPTGGSDLIAKIDSNDRLIPTDSCFSYSSV
jgi:hypothetical protein